MRFGDSFSKNLTKPCGKIQNKYLKKDGEKEGEKGKRKDGKDREEEKEIRGVEGGMGGRRGGEVCSAVAANNNRVTAASAADVGPGSAQPNW